METPDGPYIVQHTDTDLAAGGFFLRLPAFTVLETVYVVAVQPWNAAGYLVVEEVHDAGDAISVARVGIGSHALRDGVEWWGHRASASPPQALGWPLFTIRYVPRSRRIVQARLELDEGQSAPTTGRTDFFLNVTTVGHVR